MSQTICITADAVVFAKLKDEKHVLLIQRKNQPFQGKWALPGGFVDAGESVKKSCQRELKEETGLNLYADQLEFCGFYDDINRDPRSRIIAFAYKAQLDVIVDVKGKDDALDAKWFDTKKLPPLAFDHFKILENALNTNHKTNNL